MTPEQLAAIERTRARMAAGTFTPEQQAAIERTKARMEPGFLGKAQQLLRQGVETATFGLIGDEANAAFQSSGLGRMVNGLFGAETGTYDEELARERANEAQMREQHPYLSTAADVAGAVAPALTGVGAVASAPSLTAAMGRGAVIGAGMGGVQGFMEGEGDFADRARSGATSAAIGGAVGGAIPAVAQGAGAAYRGVRNSLRDRAATGMVARDLGVSPSAARVVRGVVAGDDPVQMGQQLYRGGPNAMLADASPNAAGALDAAIQSPGSASRLARQRIDGRAAGTLGRVNTALDRALGAPVGTETAQAAIRTGTASARQAAYDAAYAQPIDYAGAGQRLMALQRRIPGQAIRYANELMRTRGEQSAQIMAQIADDGAVTFSRLPDVRQWDYIKQAIDHMAETGEGAGALGGQTRMGAAYQGVSRAIRDALKDAVPEYGKALETATDAISQRKGVQFGYEMLRSGTTREAVLDAVKGTTGPEKAAMRQGLRSYIDDTLANVRMVASDQNMDAREAQKALGELTSRAAKVKLRTLLGKDADGVFSAIDEAAQALGLRANVAVNSRTAARQAFQQAIDAEAAPGVIGIAAQARPVAAGRRVIQGLTGATPEAIARRSERVRGQVADVLTRPGAGPTILRAIEQAGNANLPSMTAGRGLTSLLNLGGFSALPPTTDGLLGLLQGSAP